MSDPENKEMDVEADGDAEEDVEELDINDSKRVLATQIMQNPGVLAALQDKLGSMVGTPSGYIQSLPKPVKRRLKALKKLQAQCTDIEAEFYKEVHILECKYASQYKPLYDKRATIVTGEVEPNDDECDWPSDDEEEDKLSSDMNDKAKISEGAAGDEKKADGNKENDEAKGTDVLDMKGVPEFWLTTFKNVDMLSDMLQPHDEPILVHLLDIKVHFESEPMGFNLEFIFTPNEFFTNTTLTKEYEMKCKPEEGDVFAFEGPEIIRCKGCKIDWKPGKNVTVKLIKKKQKHKQRGQTRTVTKTVQNDSFFNFFNPPSIPDEQEGEVDEDTEALLAADFEIGHFIRERIVPRAVLYFTGEALEDDSEYDGEDDEDDEGDEEDDEDGENDPDYNPQDPQGKPNANNSESTKYRNFWKYEIIYRSGKAIIGGTLSQPKCYQALGSGHGVTNPDDTSCNVV